MKWLLSIAGIVLAFGMIKYREKLGDTIGEPEWMEKIGGVYNFILIAAIVIFFFSVAAMTGTMEYFFAPLKWILPGLRSQEPPIGDF